MPAKGVLPVIQLTRDPSASKSQGRCSSGSEIPENPAAACGCDPRCLTEAKLGDLSELGSAKLLALKGQRLSWVIMPRPSYLTTFEISQICEVNPTTVQNWIKEKKLRSF